MTDQEVLGNYKKLEHEIKVIREELRKANDEKETWFKKKESLKDDIKAQVREIKEIKSEKDKNNVQLFELKKKRDSYNKEIRKLISEKKNLNEKEKLFKKYNITLDHTKIKKQINEIEKQVEVEVSFEKEKKLMDTIKRLKRTFDQSSEVMEVSEKAKKVSKNIDDLRKKIFEVTGKISEAAHDANYDSFMAKVKGVNDTRKEQEEAFKKFIEYKNIYNSINQKLKEKLIESSKFKTESNKEKENIRNKNKQEKEKLLKEKAEEVEEKMKKKKKLTTADLIAYQGGDYFEK